MTKKIKLLFVNESLTLAGGEKSLISLLTYLNPEKYQIDLQLFYYGGELESFVPKYVNLLPPIPYSIFSSHNLMKNIGSLYKKNHFEFLLSKLSYSFKLRIGEHNHPEKAQMYWESLHNVIPTKDERYDVAIAYAQGIPTFYVADKIRADKKISWINARPNFHKKNKIFQKHYYQKFDKIVPVSDITNQQLAEIFPDIKYKLHTISDIVDYRTITDMVKEKKINFNPEVFNILTVSRLTYGSKRFDIALEACKLIKDRGLSFHWYAIGKGPNRAMMERYINQNKLENHFSFLGITPNPYPYFKAADLYVQTSEFESFGISIAEARLLNIPIVTTRYDTVAMQITHRKNGLITDLNANAVADGIEQMMKDKFLYKSIVDNLKNEKKENYESVDNFDYLVSELVENHCN